MAMTHRQFRGTILSALVCLAGLTGCDGSITDPSSLEPSEFGVELTGAVSESINGTAILTTGQGNGTPVRSVIRLSGLNTSGDGKILVLVFETRTRPNTGEYTATGEMTFDAPFEATEVRFWFGDRVGANQITLTRRATAGVVRIEDAATLTGSFDVELAPVVDDGGSPSDLRAVGRFRVF